jgi:Tol biopolymer transport system component
MFPRIQSALGATFKAPVAPEPSCVTRGARVLWTALTLCALIMPPTTHALSLNRNAAHIEWRTVETEHFRFHYPRELTEVTGHVAGIAEAVAPQVVKRYNVRLPNKVEFVVRDDIFSNGWANSLQNTMTVWSTDWDFPVRSTHNWLRDVVTHEFAHLVSIQSGSKLPPFIQGVVLGYEDYYNEPVQGSLSTIFPFMGQPAWFAEGVAQYESERAGFDAWDSHRDMLLRVSVLEDKLLPIERMDVFAGNGLEYELGPYTQGFGLTRFIAARYGDEAVLRLWAENSRIHRQTMSGAMQRVLGKSDRQIHEEWKTELTARYNEQVKAIGAQVTGQKLTGRGFYNYYPRWDAAGTGLFYVSNGTRNDFRATLGYVKLADTTKKEAERFTAIPGARGYFDVARDDSTFVFSSAKDLDPNGIRTLDIYQRNLRRKPGLLERKDPTEKRFTRDYNAVHPSLSRDGSTVTFVRGGSSNFRLYVAPVPEQDSLEDGEARAIWPPEDTLAGRFGFNIYAPRFSPDGARILFSYFNGETRNVGLINADGTGFKPILSGAHDERDPEWAPDGKSFYYVSDETGIYNIRRYDLAAGTSAALTNVVGGAFTPAVSPDGQRLAYINYDQDGFSLYLMTVADSAGRFTPGLAPQPSAAHSGRIEDEYSSATKPQAPFIETHDFEGRDQAYLPVPTRGIVTPLIFGQEAMASTRQKGVIPEDGITKWLVGVSGYLTDPVLKNELSGALLVEVGNGFDYFGQHSALVSPDKESQLFIALSNKSTPLNLGASFFRGNINSYDTITNRDVLLPGGGTGDVVDRQDYALTFKGLEASVGYDLFDATSVGDADKGTQLRMAAGYGWNDFNFYDIGGGQGFAFTYFKRLYVNTMLTWQGADYNDKGMVAPSGFAAVISHTISQNDLFACDSAYTSDCFKFENNVVVPLYRQYSLQDLDLGMSYGRAMPWAKNSSLVLSTFASSVFGLPAANPADSTSDFFEKGLMLRGYPYLRDIENLTLKGRTSLTLSADLNQPLIPDFYQRYWIFFMEDLYLNLFWEAGRAWNGSPFNVGVASPSLWKVDGREDGWFQSVGTGLKVNARIYHNYPFLMYVEGARALSGIPDGQGGFEKLAAVRIAGFDLPVTRVRFGVTFGLYNGLLGGGSALRRENRHPLNPVSPFAATR